MAKGSSSTSFAYDGQGLRQSETTGSATTQFTWATEGPLPALLSDGANSYIYGPEGTPLEQVSSAGTPTYLLSDQLGSTRALTSSAGALTASFSYDAWGNLTGSSGSATTPFMYAGQYYDAATGLYYMQARYYDPATGQFLSVDPALAETQSPYAYVGDNPLDGVDPSGLAGGLLGSFSFFGYCVRYVTCAGSAPKAHIDQDIANVAAGVLNGITFGNGETIARWLGIECNADWSSIETTVGTIVGMGLDLGFGGEEDGAALLERLSASGSELDPVDAGGQLTRAGRALAKATEVFGPTSGGPAAINEAGQEALDDILTNPGTTVETMTGGRFAGGLKFVSPDGIGAVFSPDGTFQYFGRMSP